MSTVRGLHKGDKVKLLKNCTEEDFKGGWIEGGMRNLVGEEHCISHVWGKIVGLGDTQYVWDKDQVELVLPARTTDIKVGDEVKWTSSVSGKENHGVVERIEQGGLRANEGVKVFFESGGWMFEHDLTLVEGEEDKADSEAIDVVENPKHYQFFDGLESIEVIRATLTREEFRGFCLGNKLKYRLRAGAKDAIQQEIDKSNFYDKLCEKYKDA